MKNKALSLLGMAMRAGKLASGFNRMEGAVKSGKAAAVLVCDDISAKTAKEARYLCDRYGAFLISTSLLSAELSQAIGFKCGVCAVCDRGFADKLKSILISNGKDDTNL